MKIANQNQSTRPMNYEVYYTVWYGLEKFEERTKNQIVETRMKIGRRYKKLEHRNVPKISRIRQFKCVCIYRTGVFM